MVKYLLDSDITIDFLKGKTQAVALLEQFPKRHLAISVISYAEILEGLVDDPQRKAVADEALSEVTILAVDKMIAERFALVRSDLRKAGKLIDNMDLFIAMTALAHDLILLTNNKKHFQRIDGLKIY